MIVLILLITFFAAAASVTLQPSQISTEVGGTFQLDVYVDPKGRGISAVNVTIFYDPNVFKVINVETGQLLGVDPLEPVKDVDHIRGIVTYIAARRGETRPPTSPGTVLKITFRVQSEAKPGLYNITIVARLADEKAAEILGVQSLGASVHVRARDRDLATSSHVVFIANVTEKTPTWALIYVVRPYIGNITGFHNVSLVGVRIYGEVYRHDLVLVYGEAVGRSLRVFEIYSLAYNVTQIVTLNTTARGSLSHKSYLHTNIHLPLPGGYAIKIEDVSLVVNITAYLPLNLSLAGTPGRNATALIVAAVRDVYISADIVPVINITGSRYLIKPTVVRYGPWRLRLGEAQEVKIEYMPIDVAGFRAGFQVSFKLTPENVKCIMEGLEGVAVPPDTVFEFAKPGEIAAMIQTLAGKATNIASRCDIRIRPELSLGGNITGPGGLNRPISLIKVDLPSTTAEGARYTAKFEPSYLLTIVKEDPGLLVNSIKINGREFYISDKPLRLALTPGRYTIEVGKAVDPYNVGLKAPGSEGLSRLTLSLDRDMRVVLFNAAPLNRTHTTVTPYTTRESVSPPISRIEGSGVGWGSLVYLATIAAVAVVALLAVAALKRRAPRPSQNVSVHSLPRSYLYWRGTPLFTIEGERVFGRDDFASVLAPDSLRYISSRHFKIFYTSSGWYIEDLGSKNGTYVNGAKITAPTPLKSGDVISPAGEIELIFVS